MIYDLLGVPAETVAAELGFDTKKIHWKSKTYSNPRRGYVTLKRENVEMIFVELKEGRLLSTVFIDMQNKIPKDRDSFWLPPKIKLGMQDAEVTKLLGEPQQIGGDKIVKPLGYINPWSKFVLNDICMIRFEFYSHEVIKITYSWRDEPIDF